MGKANATNILSKLPLLQLMQDSAAHEAALENTVLTQVEEDCWLTQEELNKQHIELQSLAWVLCMLLNGDHSIRAVLRIRQNICTCNGRGQGRLHK
jgi:hypothetical protein